MIKYFYAVIVICFLFSFQSFSQKSKTEKRKIQYEKIHNAVVDSQHYEFIPEYAISMNGNRTITDFFVKVSKTELRSYLPYYGVANQVDYASNSSPFDFTSTNYTYSVVDHKNGGWNITIDINDSKYSKRLLLRVFENGKATLQVMGSNWEPMSYNGYVQEVKEMKIAAD